MILCKNLEYQVFGQKKILAALDKARESSLKESELGIIILVEALLKDSDKETVLANIRVKELQRYNILPNKIFATDLKSKKKYKVLRLVADDVIYKNVDTDEVKTENINSLLKKWNKEGVKEISLISEIIKVVKQVLGPLLGVFLTSVLLGWIFKKL